MKYFVTILAALGLAGYAFIKGYSLGDSQDDGMVSPCAPQSIVTAKNPDARYSHCHDKDGSTLLRDRLAEAQERPDVYEILFKSESVPLQMMPSSILMTADDDPEPPAPTQKPSPAHRGSL